MEAVATAFTPNTTVTCPCCGKSATVTKAGAIRRHGYTIRNGWLSTADCPASRTTSVQEALLAQLYAAQQNLAAHLKVAAEKPYPRHLQNVESAARLVADARKAAGLE